MKRPIVQLLACAALAGCASPPALWSAGAVQPASGPEAGPAERPPGLPSYGLLARACGFRVAVNGRGTGTGNPLIVKATANMTGGAAPTGGNYAQGSTTLTELDPVTNRALRRLRLPFNRLSVEQFGTSQLARLGFYNADNLAAYELLAATNEGGNDAFTFYSYTTELPTYTNYEFEDASSITITPLRNACPP